jgi:hypothetical protein
MGLEAHVLDPKKFYFCVVGNAHSHVKCPFPYLYSMENYSLAQVVTCLLKIYTTSWKVICGAGVLALGTCMSKVISINTSKMPQYLNRLWQADFQMCNQMLDYIVGFL